MGISTRRRLAAVFLSALVTTGGTVVWAPPAPARAAVTRPPYHVVRPGQTLASIARTYGVGWKVIAAWNGLRPPYAVHIDDVLRLSRQPVRPLPAFRTWMEPVTSGMVNWNPARRCPISWVSLRRIWVYYVDF